ncbi:MAG: DUF2721 domain-containing protein [Candidatus Ranarchaeia archaeon]
MSKTALVTGASNTKFLLALQRQLPMAISDIVAGLAYTLTPVVLISAIGLVELMMQNRYGRVKDRVFVFIEYRNRLQQTNAPNEPLQQVERILNRYSREVWYIKNAMITGFLAISSIAITTILLLAGQFLFSTSLLEGMIVLIFAIAIFMLILSTLLMAFSLSQSQNTVTDEIKIVLPSALLYCPSHPIEQYPDPS